MAMWLFWCRCPTSPNITLALHIISFHCLGIVISLRNIAIFFVIAFKFWACSKIHGNKWRCILSRKHRHISSLHTNIIAFVAVAWYIVVLTFSIVSFHRLITAHLDPMALPCRCMTMTRRCEGMWRQHLVINNETTTMLWRWYWQHIRRDDKVL